MNDLFFAAKELIDFMEHKSWRACVIGGLAVQRWGEPRTTLDADLVLLADWGNEDKYIDPILATFKARINDAREFALTNRVLLIKASNDVAVDIALGALPFEYRMVERAVRVEFSPGLELPCCNAEDLFIMKTFAGRPRDLNDAESVARRQPALDKKYILENLADLGELKGDSSLGEKAQRILDQST